MKGARADQITFACPACGASFYGPAGSATVRCPGCKVEVETESGLARKRFRGESRKGAAR